MKGRLSGTCIAFLILLLCGCNESQNTVLAQGPSALTGNFGISIYRQIGNGVSSSTSFFGNSVGTLGISGGVVSGTLSSVWMTSTGLVQCEGSSLSGNIGSGVPAPGTFTLNISPDDTGNCLADTLTLNVVEANTGHVAVFAGGNSAAMPLKGETSSSAEIANGSMETQ